MDNPDNYCSAHFPYVGAHHTIFISTFPLSVNQRSGSGEISHGRLCSSAGELIHISTKDKLPVLQHPTSERNSRGRQDNRKKLRQSQPWSCSAGSHPPRVILGEARSSQAQRVAEVWMLSPVSRVVVCVNFLPKLVNYPMVMDKRACIHTGRV